MYKQHTKNQILGEKKTTFKVVKKNFSLSWALIFHNIIIQFISDTDRINNNNVLLYMENWV